MEKARLFRYRVVYLNQGIIENDEYTKEDKGILAAYDYNNLMKILSDYYGEIITVEFTEYTNLISMDALLEDFK
jgi:hypothetical protein